MLERSRDGRCPAEADAFGSCRPISKSGFTPASSRRNNFTNSRSPSTATCALFASHPPGYVGRPPRRAAKAVAWMPRTWPIRVLICSSFRALQAASARTVVPHASNSRPLRAPVMLARWRVRLALEPAGIDVRADRQRPEVTFARGIRILDFDDREKSGCGARRSRPQWATVPRASPCLPAEPA